MRITCPACQASYEIPDHLLVHTPERVRCARCGAEWAWARTISSPDEAFELPDLFSDAPPRHAAREPVPDLSALIGPAPEPPLREPPLREPPLREPPLREPIGSPVFDIGSELSLSPPEPLDRFLPPEPPAPPARPPDESALGEAPPPEPPRPESPPPERRKETPVDIPEVPFPKAPAVQARRPPPLARAETPVEIPQVPFPKVREQKREPQLGPPTVSNLAHERAMSREEAFRRVIETTRQRSQAAPPRRPSRRPQIIAILAVILLIAVIFGVHFALVHGFAAGITG